MKKLFKTLLISAGLTMAVTPQIVQSANSTTVERQAINDTRLGKRYNITNHIGGAPLVTEYFSTPGLTPKEYGMLYGNGKSRKTKTNRLLTAKRAKARH